MSDTPAMPYDYQSEGGALLIDAPTYVKRKADDELYEGLKAGQFCYVLNARQMGKSSLKVRTIQRLRDEGVACAAVDLQGIGTSATEEQWYFGIISRIARSLGLHRQFNLNSWWTEQPRLSYVQRFVEFLESLLLPSVAEPIVIFIDEVDLTLNLSFRDDFFGALRESYNRRADELKFRRLSFALFGVATPSDLIQNKQITPFNIGRPVDLTGFQVEEAQPLIPGLITKAKNPQALLQAVLEWTGGQPFLTQKLCKLAQVANSESLEGQESEWVERLVQTRVIENWEAQDIPPHLKTIRDRLLLSGEQRTGRLLGLYQQILQQGEIAADDSPEQVELRLTGLVVKRDGKLRVYNCIYEQVFNWDWLGRSLSELRPYGAAIAAWLESGSQDESRLLRGQALQDARTWAEGKSLGDEDRRFLDASQELEKRDFQRKLAAEEEAKEVLKKANHEANRLINRGKVALAVMTPLAIILGGFSLWSSRQSSIAQVKLAVAKQQTESTRLENETLSNKNKDLSQQIGTATNELSVAKAKEKDARNREKQANQNLETAQQREAIASQQAKLAEEQASRAKQEKELSQQQTRVAKFAQEKAQEGTRLEQIGASALRQFESQEIDSLLLAIQAGRKLKSLVGNGNFSEKYPTVSPIFALQKILFSIKQKNRFDAYNGPAYDIKFLAKSNQIITSNDEVTSLWNISGQKIHDFPGKFYDLSSDGKRLITQEEKDKPTYYQIYKIWDLPVKRTIGELKPEKNLPIDHYRNKLSSDGELLAIVKNDLIELRARTGKLIATFNGSKINFSSDGQQIFVAGYDSDKTYKFWLYDKSGKKIIERVVSDVEPVTNSSSPDFSSPFSIFASPSGKRVLIAASDLWIWDLTDSKKGIYKLPVNYKDIRVTKVTFSQDNENIFSTIFSDGRAFIWEKDSLLISFGEQVGSLQQSSNKSLFIKKIEFRPESGIRSRQVVFVNEAGESRLLDLETGQSYSLRGHSGGVNSFDFSEDGNLLASVSNDGNVIVWNIQNRQNGWVGGNGAIAFKPNTSEVAIGQFSQVTFWSLNKISEKKFGFSTSNTCGGEIVDISFSPDGDSLATSSFKQGTCIWDISGKLIRQLGPFTKFSFSPNGKQIVTAGDREIWLWNFLTNKRVKLTTGFSSVIEDIRFTSKNQLALVVFDGTNRLGLLQDLTGKKLAQFKQHEKATKIIRFSPVGDRLVTVGETDEISTWYLQKNGIWKRESIFNSLHGKINNVIFSPNGQLLATVGADQTVRVWMLRESGRTEGHSWQQQAEFQAERDTNWDLAFSSDSKMLALSGRGPQGVTQVWRLYSLDELLTQSCNWLKDYFSTRPDSSQLCRKL